MKRQKTIAAIIGILLCLTAAAAVLHMASRENVPEGTLLIVQGEEKHYTAPEELVLSEVSGTVVNGKGEEKRIQGMGIALAEVLSAAGIDVDVLSSVTVEADDSYSAELLAEEVKEENRAFLLMEEDGTMRLAVFGDTNSKRNVKNVSGIIVR